VGWGGGAIAGWLAGWLTAPAWLCAGLRRLLQYRLNSWSCSWRAFDGGNVSVVTGWTYSIEPHLHELMLHSPHR
jgi:ABC-type thiamine transport system substrate-binding protein